MIDELKKEIKKIKGNVLCVSILEVDILTTIEKSKKINPIYLNEGNKKFFKKEKDNESKDVKLNKLKKEIPFELDYILCDVNGLNIYLGRFVSASYDICHKKILFYGKYDEYDVDRLANKYSRYNAKCTKMIYKDSFILKVDLSNVKVRWFDKFKYSIKDFFRNVLEGIGNLLMG